MANIFGELDVIERLKTLLAEIEILTWTAQMAYYWKGEMSKKPYVDTLLIRCRYHGYLMHSVDNMSISSICSQFCMLARNFVYNTNRWSIWVVIVIDIFGICCLYVDDIVQYCHPCCCISPICKTRFCLHKSIFNTDVKFRLSNFNWEMALWS